MEKEGEVVKQVVKRRFAYTFLLRRHHHPPYYLLLTTSLLLVYHYHFVLSILFLQISSSIPVSLLPPPFPY
jgi:hypothetical protein